MAVDREGVVAVDGLLDCLECTPVEAVLSLADNVSLFERLLLVIPLPESPHSSSQIAQTRR